MSCVFTHQLRIWGIDDTSSTFKQSLTFEFRIFLHLVLYSRNTNKYISGNLIKHNLWTSMNEQTRFFIKIYLSHFILERVDVYVVCERWVERHILRERISSSDIFFQEPVGCQHLDPLASSPETPLLSCVSLARLWFSALSLNLAAWFSSCGLLPVTHLFDLNALIMLSCLLITTWQLVKAHMVTRNEPKIHGICYITLVIQRLKSPVYHSRGQNSWIQVVCISYDDNDYIISTTWLNVP